VDWFLYINYIYPKAIFLLAFGFDILACPARFELATYFSDTLS